MTRSAVRILALLLVAAALGMRAGADTRPVLDDPARILFRRGALDVLRLHGALTPATPMDPLTDGFAVVLSNADGVLFRAELLPADFVGRRRPRFLDRGASARGGLYKVSLLRDGDRVHFGVQAYAELARATVPTMTIQIAVGDDVFVSKADWRRTRSGWLLGF